VRLADRFGIRAVGAEGAAALRRELSAAMAANAPAVIEVTFKLADVPSPWRHLAGVPKRRGPDATL
jgi:thiamine pyrophosphate-dependent acetolactate synthase large subunit-like protein